MAIYLASAKLFKAAPISCQRGQTGVVIRCRLAAPDATPRWTAPCHYGRARDMCRDARRLDSLRFHFPTSLTYLMASRRQMPSRDTLLIKKKAATRSAKRNISSINIRPRLFDFDPSESERFVPFRRPIFQRDNSATGRGAC